MKLKFETNSAASGPLVTVLFSGLAIKTFIILK